MGCIELRVRSLTTSKWKPSVNQLFPISAICDTRIQQTYTCAVHRWSIANQQLDKQIHFPSNIAHTTSHLISCFHVNLNPCAISCVFLLFLVNKKINRLKTIDGVQSSFAAGLRFLLGRKTKIAQMEIEWRVVHVSKCPGVCTSQRKMFS